MPMKSLLIAAAALTTGALASPAMADQDMPIRGTVIFWLLDRNNDGAIDKTEIDALRTIIFDAVDANRDGRVSKEEFTDVVERAHEWRGERGGHMRRSHLEERGDKRDDARKADFAERRGERLMERLGIDEQDGLSRTEFVGRTPRLFEQADQDRNGSLSKSEFEEADGRIGRLVVME